jgi:hypothetical protein
MGYHTERVTHAQVKLRVRTGMGSMWPFAAMAASSKSVVWISISYLL